MAADRSSQQQVVLIPLAALGITSVPANRQAAIGFPSNGQTSTSEEMATCMRAALSSLTFPSQRAALMASVSKDSQQNSVAVSSGDLAKACCLRFPGGDAEEVSVSATDNCELVQNSERLDLCCFCLVDFGFAAAEILQPEAVPEFWKWRDRALITDKFCFSYTQLRSQRAQLLAISEKLRLTNTVALATVSSAPDAIAMLIASGSQFSSAYRLPEKARIFSVTSAPTSTPDDNHETMHCLLLQRRLNDLYEPVAARASCQLERSRQSDALEKDCRVDGRRAISELLTQRRAQLAVRASFADAFQQQKVVQKSDSSKRRKSQTEPSEPSNSTPENVSSRLCSQKRLPQKQLTELLKQWASESASKLESKFDSAGAPILSALIRGHVLKRGKKSLSRANYEEFVEIINNGTVLNNVVKQYGKPERENSGKTASKSAAFSRSKSDSAELPATETWQNGDSMRVERVQIAEHVVDVLSVNDCVHWPESDNRVSESTFENSLLDGELILNGDEEAEVEAEEQVDLANEDSDSSSVMLVEPGEVDATEVNKVQPTEAEAAVQPMELESETMLALIREARSSRTFHSPSNVPLSVTDERLRDQLAQEAISVALRTRNRVTLQTLFGILRQHCVRIRGRSLMSSMTKLGYKFDRRLRCYVKS